MQEKIDFAIAFLTDWLKANVLTWNTAVQWSCVVGAYLVAALLWRGLERRLFARVDEKFETGLGRSLLRALVDVGNVAVFILFMQICASVFRVMEYVPRVIDAASDLAVAWIVIRLVTSMMPNRALARGVATLVWAVAALNVFGLLSPITDFLAGLSFSVGDNSFNALEAVKGLALAAVFLQAAAITGQFADRRIQRIRDLSPSLRVLMIKAVKVVLFTAAVLAAMSSVGIDLTSLAIFSSALGVGIGFGLQTIISNYVAGVILLMDRSIKPGDTIEVGSVYGVVRGMFGRYASVLTRDGTEYLIPNQQLVSNEVVNWTYSDTNVRLKVPVGISYGSDVEKALVVLPSAIEGVSRVLRSPAPIACMVGFGDSSVDLELRIWIADADKGVTNVRSEVMLNIWRLFHENGIEFPFPQRDVHIKPDSAIAVKIEKDGGE
jgi:small-conductance mechanosensitive channel